MIQKFDSKEEYWFNEWLKEVRNLGYIRDIIYQPESYQLFNGVKKNYYKTIKGKEVINEQLIFHGHKYTPDYQIEWDEKAKGIFFEPFISDDKKTKDKLIGNVRYSDNSISYFSVTEVKASFDYQNMSRLSMLNIKWVAEKYKHIIDLVKIPDLFKETFTPKMYLLTDKLNGTRKLNYEPITIEQFINKVP